jgi:hypothetical protein
MHLQAYCFPPDVNDIVIQKVISVNRCLWQQNFDHDRPQLGTMEVGYLFNRLCKFPSRKYKSQAQAEDLTPYNWLIFAEFLAEEWRKKSIENNEN